MFDHKSNTEHESIVVRKFVHYSWMYGQNKTVLRSSMLQKYEKVSHSGLMLDSNNINSPN